MICELLLTCVVTAEPILNMQFEDVDSSDESLDSFDDLNTKVDFDESSNQSPGDTHGIARTSSGAGV